MYLSDQYEIPFFVKKNSNTYLCNAADTYTAVNKSFRCGASTDEESCRSKGEAARATML